MSINLKAPELRELKPRIMVCGVGGAGGNAVNNMIVSGLAGVDFIVANTDAQALTSSRADRIIQMGLQVTEGLGAGSKPEVGRAAAEEAMEEIRDHLAGAHMCFVTAGMGGGTGTGAAPVIARIAREMGILTVGVVTKPFQFEGGRRMRLAEGGIAELQKSVDTLIIIPNQNLFRVANEKTTFADAFAMADQVLYSGVACITDLMVKEGLINLDFADVRSIMSEMGKAMMGTGEATGERRAVLAAEAAIANPLLDETSMRGARGLLISITGGNDLTLYEVDEAASRIRQEVDEEANIILGATFDSALDGVVRVSVVATGIDQPAIQAAPPAITPAQVEAARPRVVATRSIPQPQPVEYIEAPAPVESAHHDVEIREAAPRQVHYADYAPQAHEEPQAQEFIAPEPEPVVIRQTRMPQIEDLPRIAQEQLRQHRGEAPAPVETRRKTLLEKLAAFGITRQEEPAAQAPVAAPAAFAPPPTAAPAPAASPLRPIPAPLRPNAATVHADYGRPQQRIGAPRPVQGQLDAQGRQPVRPPAMEDDHLEIPAFLRRQAN